ncbi:MAG: DUF1659 domain-containing protein [Clostridium sp.]|nr:DUF1659 domain-containing protein [Clostridium sp.]
MDFKKITATTSMQIEVANGQDSSGNTTYKKKSFNNVKANAPLADISAVANAIKDVMEAETRNVLLAETSTIVEEA